MAFSSDFSSNKNSSLINNAAYTPRTRQETPEGIEMQFATNVLGYFRVIDEFTDILKASAPARVVNVASYWEGGLELNDLERYHFLMVQQLNLLLAVHIFKPPTLSKIFGLRRVKVKTLIKADNNNQTTPDKGACEARLID
jgi:hypothetical protein